MKLVFLYISSIILCFLIGLYVHKINWEMILPSISAIATTATAFIMLYTYFKIREDNKYIKLYSLVDLELKAVIEKSFPINKYEFKQLDTIEQTSIISNINNNKINIRHIIGKLKSLLSKDVPKKKILFKIEIQIEKGHDVIPLNVDEDDAIVVTNSYINLYNLYNSITTLIYYENPNIDEYEELINSSDVSFEEHRDCYKTTKKIK